MVAAGRAEVPHASAVYAACEVRCNRCILGHIGDQAVTIGGCDQTRTDSRARSSSTDASAAGE